MRERVVVVGGNAAGMTAASRAKRLKPDLDVTILEAGRFISYSICGVPHFVAGLVAEHEQLIAFTPERLEQERGIRARTRLLAERILPAKRVIECKCLETGAVEAIAYDHAVICTGYTPRVPDVAGFDLRNVLTVSRLEDALALRRLVASGASRRAAVVGGGYIGLMMAHGLRLAGLEVTLFEKNRRVFSQVDEEPAEWIEAELRRNGVKLVAGAEVRRLRGRDGAVESVEVGRDLFPADLALVDVGVGPNVALAENSGVPLGLSGAVLADPRGMTPIGGVFAAGNCAETFHLVSGRPLFSSLGTTAAKQGRIVGENLAGWRSSFGGTLETSVEKVFDLSVGRTGLTLTQAHRAGFDADSVWITGRDRASYYPGSAKLGVKLIFEKRTGRLLGGQLAGSDSAVKRIDTLVTALTAKMTLRDLAQLDLAYAPAFATLWDPIQVAANVALRR